MPAPLRSKLIDKLGLKPAASTLFKPPQKEKGADMPHTTVYHQDAVHQADLLFLPWDKVRKKTYKYALVVVDLHSRLTDAEPIEDKKAEMVSQAIQRIYRRQYLDYPNRLETDPGSEFKGEFAAHMQSKNIELRYGLKGRHRQQSMVESRNHTIGYALNLRMAMIEQVTGQTSRDWVQFLPEVIRGINEDLNERDMERKKNGKKPVDPADKEVRCKGKACELLEEGTRVRVPLEEPRDNVTGEVLQGKFRAGDKRWDDRVRKIYQVLLRPDQPVLYIVTKPESDEPEKVARTRQQIQVVAENEPEPDARKLNIRPENDTFQVRSLEDRRKNKNRIEYLVRWVGYPDPKDYTWESRSKLVKESGDAVKKMVLDYEKINQ